MKRDYLPGGDAEPWRYEPNRVAWRDSTTGLQCLVLRGPLGSLCGYVRVPRGHAMHGKDYNNHQGNRLRVHGGITFAGCLGGRRMKRGHWFGFDCAHYDDIVPGMVELYDRIRDSMPPHLRDIADGPGQVYRTVDYVRQECTGLAEQLARKANHA